MCLPPLADWWREFPAEHPHQRHQAGRQRGQGAQHQAHGEAPPGKGSLTNNIILQRVAQGPLTNKNTKLCLMADEIQTGWLTNTKQCASEIPNRVAHIFKTEWLTNTKQGGCQISNRVAHKYKTGLLIYKYLKKVAYKYPTGLLTNIKQGCLRMNKGFLVQRPKRYGSSQYQRKSCKLAIIKHSFS